MLLVGHVSGPARGLCCDAQEDNLVGSGEGLSTLIQGNGGKPQFDGEAGDRTEG